MNNTPPGVIDALTRMHSGTLTSVELTRAGIGRIETLDARIEAWAHLDPARALECAAQRDRERTTGANLPLLGLPIGVKDVIETAGLPTRMGSAVYENHVPQRSATAVARLEAAGAFVFGKTVTTEFATQHAGKTRNPWSAAHTPGGSSSGSAAAVAAGFVPAAIGTQTRGSVIRPAAYCGVVGFKPSYGLIPVDGVFPLSHTLDHIGVIARTIADAAHVAACMITPHALPGGTAALSQLTVPAKPPRLAAVRTPLWPLADANQTGNFADSVRRLRDAGAEVIEIELPPDFDRAMQAVKAIQLREIADRYADKLAGWGDLVSTEFIDYVAGGVRVSREEYAAALALRTELIRQYGEFIGAYDAIITPPATGEAPAGLKFTGDASFCAIWTLCGMPALTIPSGRGPHGLPLGLQIVGAGNRDSHVVGAAAWCEGVLDKAGSGQGPVKS
jgi:Asp-tRNA(Asn)/Glu-tRNA(Gln) amidotransferase A subunit family amidase